MKTRVNRVFIAGIAIAISALLGAKLVYKGKSPIPAQGSSLQVQRLDNQRARPVANDKRAVPQLTLTPPPDAGPASASAEYGQSLEDIADEVIEKIRPAEWKRQRFDGQAEHFSGEDLEKALRIVSRHFDNFSKIRSVRFEQVRRCEFPADNELARSEIARKRSDAHNFAFTVEANRAPAYLKIQGFLANGEQVEEIVTAAGKFTSGHIRYAESFMPAYLDGERWVVEYSLLTHGDRVQEDRRMDYDLPELAEPLRSKDLENSRYDVIEDIKDDVGLVNTYWFNRETGMLDFLITRRSTPKKDENPTYSAAMIDYYRVDGIYYFKSYMAYDCDFHLRYEENITDLVLNGSRESR
jgi:hypothetical protein